MERFRLVDKDLGWDGIQHKLAWSHTPAQVGGINPEDSFCNCDLARHLLFNQIRSAESKLTLETNTLFIAA